MLLTINAIGASVTFADPNPYEGAWTAYVEMGTSKTKAISSDQLNRITPMLVKQAAANAITWSVAADSEVAYANAVVNNRVASGAVFEDPATPSSQASGAVAPSWLVSFVPGVYSYGGIVGVDPEIEASMPVDPTPPTLAVGQSVVAAMVAAKYLDGTVGLAPAIFGAPATAGSQVPPTDATIQARLIADVADPTNGYIRLALLTLNRTADTVVTQTQDNTWRDL